MTTDVRDGVNRAGGAIPAPCVVSGCSVAAALSTVVDSSAHQCDTCAYGAGRPSDTSRAHRSGALTRSLAAGPSVLELEYLGSNLEVGVVVHDRHPVLSREYRRQQIDHAHRSMP